jgi:hypothetical protein
MAAPKQRTPGERLRDAADRLYAVAERADIPQRSLVGVQMLHDEIETIAGDVRAVVRGSTNR